MSNTRLYIGTELLDFNSTINVKRQLNDYRDLSVGSSNKSYTLEIPLTRTNMRVLEQVQDVRSRQEVEDEARLVVNGTEVIKGKFRILQVNAKAVKGIIEADDWVDEIAANALDELDWSGDTHTFNATNIVNSWSAAAGALYRYPMINLGQITSENWGPNAPFYPYDFPVPAWNVEDIVTKLLAASGYTLAASGFFAGTFGRSLYLLSRPAAAREDYITGKGMHAYANLNNDNYDSDVVATGDPISLQVNQVLVMDAEVEDEGSDYSTATHRYTAPEDGTYRLQTKIEVWSDANRNPAKYTVSGNTIAWSIRKNGTALESHSDSGTSLFDSGNEFTLDTGYVYLEAGDYIDVHVNITVNGSNNSPNPENIQLYIVSSTSDDSYLKTVWDYHCRWPGVGQTMSPADWLPALNGLDFLKGLKQAFNLRFWVDRMNRTVYVETSDDFYGTTVVDWSEKVDYGAGYEMEVIASNYKNVQRFKWRPDTGDKAYTNYVNENGVPFTKELTLASEYVRQGVEERENDVFAPTVRGKHYQIGHYGALVPQIHGSGDYVSTARPYPADFATQWEPRLLEWKGLVSLGTGNFWWYGDFEDSSYTNYTTFPSVETPDMSDVFDDYLLKDWRRIEKNKILTCTLWLTPAEIMKFMTVVGTAANEGFRATYKIAIEGVPMYWVCSRITTDGDRVKCEFIQKM